MKILFLGTRGGIRAKSPLHQRHTVTVITYRGTRVAIDCGLDWLNHMDIIHPDAIVITHAHEDHVDGLRNGAPCPVYATAASAKRLKQFPIKDGIVVKYREPFAIGHLIFEAFFVKHSFRAPAVGYRITAGSTTIFCVHDLLAIKNRTEALHDIQLYIGDGAALTRPILRYTKENQPFGHTSIDEQLKWCKKAHVPRAVFTHCGSHIVKDDLHATVAAKVVNLGSLYGVEASIAHDDLKITL